MKLRDLFSSPETWIQGDCAQNKGYSCSYDEGDCFCLFGGFLRVYAGTEKYEDVLQRLRVKLNGGISAIAEWNDAPERTFQDIVNLVTELDI